MTENTVRVYPCASWEDFIVKVRPMRFAATTVYRGQRDPTWSLSSKWERYLEEKKGGDPSRNVRELFSDGAYEAFRDIPLRQFKDLAKGLPELHNLPAEDADDEWWALARHHGMSTPLLDWTGSPYIAAYFAFIDMVKKAMAEGIRLGDKSFDARPEGNWYQFEKGHVDVWELNFMEELMGKLEEFRLIWARWGRAHRQKAQRGLFSQLTHDVHVDLEAYLVDRELATYLGRYEIPCREMATALTDLRHMNIRSSTLFPDLDGAAEEASLWEWIGHWRSAQHPR